MPPTRRPPSASSELQRGDVKTLRMATPEVSAELLERFIAFQRAWLEAARRVDRRLLISTTVWESVLSVAHQDAAAASGLDGAQTSRLEALARDFCGQRSVRRRLTRRLAAGGLSADAKARLEEELATEGAKVEALRRRYGDGAVELLLGREDELLELHQAISEALSAGG